jgi:uncharacterized RDD family membrane protein YckC
VELDDRHVTATPEGVRLDVVLAGLGSRFQAYVLDLVLQVVAFVLFDLAQGAAVGGNSSETVQLIATGALSLFAFFDFVGYFVLCEMLWNGRSIGKRAAGIRVVRVDGGPVGFFPSLIRNVLRLVDFLPSAYVAGMLTILVTPRNQRLGDLAARTVVIRDRMAAAAAVPGQAWTSSAGFSASTGSQAFWAPGAPSGTWLPPALMHWDVSAVPAPELAMARTFLANRAGYTPEARQRLAADLANRIWPFVAGPTVPPHPEAFLEMVLQVKGARG